MQTRTVNQQRGDTLAKSMLTFHLKPKSIPEGYHSVTVEPGVAMLVEPLNAETYIFVLPNVVHQYESIPGSGTDKLKQRMLAAQHFSQIVDAANSIRGRPAAEETAVSLAEPQSVRPRNRL